MEDVLYLIGGLAVLVFAGDLLVKGAVSLAVKLKVSLLVIGVVVVSFGTSAPELLVSLKAALEGHPDISIGNVVGSNIANISLVLGLTAVVFPIYVVYDTLRYDWPVMFLATLLLILFSMDFVLQRWEGIILFLILIGYSVFLIRKSRKEKKNKEVVEEERNVSFFKALLYVLAGGVGLSYGADWLVQGASGIALKLGVSERTIAVSVVAFGTSVPELTASLIAAFRKQMDVSVGNLIGSNIFNILSILGITAMVHPVHVSETIIKYDYWWMFGVALLLFPLMVFDRKISGWKGTLLFLYYVAYIIFVVYIKI